MEDQEYYSPGEGRDVATLWRGQRHVRKAKVDMDKITVPSERWTHCLFDICVLLSTYWAEKPRTSRGLESLKSLLGAMKLTHIFNKTLQAAFDQEAGDKVITQEKA